MTHNATICPSASRIPWLDTAKGLGLLCVIFGHLQVPYLSTWIYTFHMPLFFFLSGIVFSGEKYSFREFLLRKIKTLVIPYFVLGSGILLFYCADFARRGLPASAYLEMLKQFLLQEHYWTIWFLACLFLSEMLYELLSRLAGRSAGGVTLLSLILCVFGLLRYRLGWGSLPWNLDIAFIAQFFLHAGHRMRPRLTALPDSLADLSVGKKVGIACSLLALNGGTGLLCIRVSGQSLDMSIGMYGNEVLTFVSAFAGTLLIVFASMLFSNPVLSYLGRNTMIIFAWHSRIIIVFCGYVYDYFGLFQGEAFGARLLYAAVTASVIFVILLPVTKWLKHTSLAPLFGLSKSC